MEFKTVFDFLKSVPAAMRHSEIYDNKVRRKLEGEGTREVDLVEFEKSTVSIGEMNILLDTPIPEKFILDDLDSGFEISSGTLAKQKQKAAGKGSLTHTKDYKEDFVMEKTIELNPSHSVIWHSTSSSFVDTSDNLYRTLMPHLAGISTGQATSGAIRVVGNKIEVAQDLRKIFLKGYLTLMSYNLAVTSHKDQLKSKDITVDSDFNISPSARLASLMGRRIVVDVENLTREEVALLAELSCEYPRKRYGKDNKYTKNVYNNIRISEDDLILIGSDDQFNFDGLTGGYGSPERLWHDLVGLACKLEALGDLQSVIADMRGLPFILRDISETTGLRCFNLKYPDSYSIKAGVSHLGRNNYHICRDSNYYSTSKCLIADLLLGHCMILGAFNVIEEVGGLGIVGCPSGEAMTDNFLNSTLRDRGLKSDNCHENALLHEWRGVRGRECSISFGGKLKDYCLRIASRIRNGNAGFLRPMMLHSLPYSNCRDTTWATVRGWESKSFSFDKKITDRIKINLMTKAFTWTMGVSEDVPKIGLNAIGETKMGSLSLEETKLIQLAEGNYEISVVRHVINGKLGPRLDEMEMGPTAFYNTNFPGVKCTIVFDNTNLGKVVTKEVMTTEKAHDTIGAERPPQSAALSYGGSKVTIQQSKKLPKGVPVLNGRNETVNELQMTPNEGNNTEPVTPNNTEKVGSEDKEDTPSLPIVTVTPGPTAEIVLNNNRTERELPDREVELVGGKSVTLKKKLGVEHAEEGRPLRGYLVNTKGDGKCGAHAIINDFFVRNAISKEDRHGAAMELTDELVSKNWFSDDELGAWLTNHNLGLYVLADNEIQSISAYEPKSGNPIHNVFIHMKDGHYSTFIPDEKGDYTFTPKVINMCSDLGETQDLIAVKRMDRVVGGPLWESLEHIAKSMDPNNSNDKRKKGWRRL